MSRPNASQGGWWSGFEQGIRELVNVGKRHVVVPDDVATSPDLPKLRDPARREASAEVEAELVNEEPCEVTRGCSRRNGHEPPCVLPSQKGSTP